MLSVNLLSVAPDYKRGSKKKDAFGNSYNFLVYFFMNEILIVAEKGRSEKGGAK